MSPRPTPEQQAAVSARGKVIVSASAGSGKTFVMIERLVALIVGGADVRKCSPSPIRGRRRRRCAKNCARRSSKRWGDAGGRRARPPQSTAFFAAPCRYLHHARLLRPPRAHLFLCGGHRPRLPHRGEDDAEWKTYSARALDETFDEAYKNGGEEFRALLSFYFRKRATGR